MIWDAEIYEDEENYCAVPGQISEISKDGATVVITGNGKIKVTCVEKGDFIGKPALIVKSIRKRLQ